MNVCESKFLFQYGLIIYSLEIDSIIRSAFVSIPIWSDYLYENNCKGSNSNVLFLFQYGLIIYKSDKMEIKTNNKLFLFQYGLIIYK